MLDGHGVAVRAKEKLVRDGHIDEKRIFLWEREFEDCFRTETILAGFKAWAEEIGIHVNLTEAELESTRKGDKSVSHFLSGVAHSTGHDIDKKAVGQRIAEEAVAKNEESDPKRVILEIIRQVNSDFQPGKEPP